MCWIGDLLIVALLLFGAASAASLHAGPWRLDSGENESVMVEILSELSFRPALAGEPSSWWVSSQSYLLSNSHGDLSDTILLSANCKAGNASCVPYTLIYQSIDGKIIRLANLSFSSNNGANPSVWEPLAQSSSDFSMPMSSGISDITFNIPQEWRWVLALGTTAFITIVYLARRSD